MKIYFVILFLILSTKYAYSQKQVLTYVYDGCGNIISRYYSSAEAGDNENVPISNPDDKSRTISISDNLYDIHVMPSPTTGRFNVAIPKYRKDQKGVLAIIDTSCAKAKMYNFSGPFNTYDISEMINGVYVLHFLLDIETNQKQYTIKIIKK